MLNYLKFIEILISLQFIFISTMVPVFFKLPFKNHINNSLELPITWQIPIVILLTLFFKKKVIFKSLTIYLLLGLFIIPVFHQGGSLGYLLTPNFGYLIGLFPLINIIDKLNNKNKISIAEFLKSGILAISTMHLTGLTYSFIQTIYSSQYDVFLYNMGKYTIGKVGYHFLMLIPLSMLIKSITYIRNLD